MTVDVEIPRSEGSKAAVAALRLLLCCVGLVLFVGEEGNLPIGGDL